MKRDLAELTEREHDLLVIGGGIYGACCAWDAAQRGLKVALVEAADFGSGTSWNSLKTIHGGLRYLQTLDVRRLRESVRERSTLLRIAPELVRPLPFVIPTYGHGSQGPEALGLGIMLNDLLSFDRNRALPPEREIPPGRTLSRQEVLAIVPGAPTAGLSGGALYYDGQLQSGERLLLAFLHAAADAGATLVNYAEVVGLKKQDGRIVGARVRDHEDGAHVEVRSRLTLNAAGPGIARVLALAGVPAPAVPLLRACNLVLKRAIVGMGAVGMRSAGRFLFAVPWNGRTLVGTSYEPASTTGPNWRGFVEQARVAFPWADLTPEDVALVHQGLVPGQSASALGTRPLLIDHAAQHGVAGLVSILGVKYTTARGLAERAIDLVGARLDQGDVLCQTASTPLTQARPLSGPLAERVRIAVREEQALHLSDAVMRRLDLGTAGPPSEADLAIVSDVMATELGWSLERRQAEQQALAANYPPAR
jgi:glycerol-3-phosphate dehydrogenase